MIKYLLAVAALVGLTIYVSVKDEHAAQNAARKSANGYNCLVAPCSEPKNNGNRSQSSIENTEGKLPSWYGFFRWPNGTTTWAIILTLLVIAEQTSETARAARATEKSANALLSIERAWVDVSLKQSGPAYYPVIITNHGRTVAIIKHFHLILDFPKGSDIVSRQRELPKSKILGSNAQWNAIELNLMQEISNVDWENIKLQKVEFSYYGTLHYEDMSGKPHTTGFRFLYRHGTGLVQLDEPEYNQHT